MHKKQSAVWKFFGTPQRLVAGPCVLLLIVAIVMGFSDTSEAKRKTKPKARKGIYALYQNPIAGFGQCVPAVSDPTAVLNRNGIKVKGASAKEKGALAKGIAQIERLLGGDPLPKPWRQQFTFLNASGKWNQGTVSINVRRPVGSSKGLLTGRMMHELGHKVGNSGVYGKYKSFVKGNRCQITPYACKKHNEEFAEVFEAYVVYPELLAKKCPRAYKFFSTKLFPGSSNSLASCQKKPNIVLPARIAVIPTFRTDRVQPDEGQQ